MSVDKERREPIARAALAIGLLGAGLGLFVGLSQWVSELGALARFRPAPYALGGLALLVAIVSLVVEGRSKTGSYALLAGVVSVVIVPGMVFALMVLVLAAVVLAVISP